MRKLFLVLITLLGFISTGCSSNGVQVYFGSNPLLVRITDSSQTLSEALESRGLKISEIKDKYEPSIAWDHQLMGSSSVKLTEKPEVTLIVHGKKKGIYRTAKPTVASFLSERRVKLTKWDQVRVPLKSKIRERMVIRVDRFEQVVKQKIVTIPFQEKEKLDSNLMVGCKEVTVAGKPGKEIYRIVGWYLNGKLVARRGQLGPRQQKILSTKPVTQMVSVGTNTSFSSLTVQSTAYSYTGGRTATGTKPKKGTIAVDPRVFPLGTRFYIPGYGYGVAEDTGGVIKGRIIDLFFHSRSEAMKWGRRTIKIRIIR